jgi:hypothetical protein
VSVGAGLAALTLVLSIQVWYAGAQAGCYPFETPVGQANPPGQMEPLVEVGCAESVFPLRWVKPLTPTRVNGANSWLDDFTTGQIVPGGDRMTLVTFNDGDVGYRLFPNSGASTFKTNYFLHMDHWMVDVTGDDSDATLPGGGPTYWNVGNSVLRPDRSFTFQNGHLVVDTDVAAGIDDYGGQAWPEIVISAAPGPTSIVDGLYAYGDFGGWWTIGCRLQASRIPICALYDNSGRTVAQGGRVTEVGYFVGNSTTYGGYITQIDRASGQPLGNFWRQCASNTPDFFCRDRFRLDLTQNSLTLYVNGVRYFEADGGDLSLPPDLTQGPVYVYLASVVYKPNAASARFHWDHLAVNPPGAMGVADSWGLTAPPQGPPEALDTCLVTQCFLTTTPGPSAMPSSTPVPPTNTTVATPTNTPVPPTSTAVNTPTRTPTPTGATPTPTPGGGGGGGQTIDFGNLTPVNHPLDGQSPTGVIDWGSGQWFLSGPWAQLTGNSVSFVNEGATSAAFTFLQPRRLIQLEADNGGPASATVTLSCSGQPAKQATVPAGQVVTIATGWSGGCTTVTVGASNGWFTNFTDLQIDAGQQLSVSFDDLSNPNRPLTGQYPSGVIDWGNGAWWLSGPYGQFQSNSISFNGAGPKSAAFTLVTAHTLAQFDAFNGGTASTTVTVSCPGQATKSTTLASNQLTTIKTGWSGTCASVTIGSSNGWDTNFDNLIVQ